MTLDAGPNEELRPSPSAWVRRFAHLVRTGGSVLDVAAGSGRHSRFFLDRGHSVTAVDVDVTPLGEIGADERFAVVEADLEIENAWPFEDRQFDLVLVTNYLYRPLFPRLRASIAPGGILIYETFALGNAEFGRPRNADFLLRPGELLAEFGGTLQVVAYEHGFESEPRPAVRQRLVATRGGDPVGLSAPAPSLGGGV